MRQRVGTCVLVRAHVRSCNMDVCVFIRLCLWISRWEWVCLYVDTLSCSLCVTLRMRMCVFAWVTNKWRDGNPCAFASQLQSWSVERDSPWCRYPNRGNLNQADTLLAHPAPAPNCSWQYQTHPIGCSTAVQFSWPLPPVQRLKGGSAGSQIIYWKEKVLFLKWCWRKVWLLLTSSSSKMR